MDAAQEHSRAPGESGSLTPENIETELARILNSKEFLAAERLRQFLVFVVREHLRGHHDGLKESTIAVEVFGLPPGFDPRQNAIVRSTAKRLREKLKKYYHGEGSADSVLIELPEGHYIPQFTAWLLPESGEHSETEPHQVVARKRLWRSMAAIAVMAVLVLAAGIQPGRILTHPPRPPAAPQWGRLLVRATSEGYAPPRIDLQHDADFLALTPDGRKVYAASPWSPFLSIVGITDRTVKTLKLPGDGGPLVMSPDGSRLYIGSRSGSIMVVDTGIDHLIPKTVATPGSVFSMAITPDGRKLFLAMSRNGVWCLLTTTGSLHQVTKRRCPESLAVDAQGKRLYVSYQCGDYRGHDSVEILDTKTEKVAAVVNGLAMVGGYPFSSPDDRLLMLDGTDACANPGYDQKGCPSDPRPSRVVHFLTLPDYRVERTVGMPTLREPAGFIDSAKALFLGAQISVMDTFEYTETEKWEHPPDFFRGVVVDSAHRKAYVIVREGKQLLSLGADNPECAPILEGLASFYTGDGVLEDIIGGMTLSAIGDVRFGQGRVGQAFVLDGRSAYLAVPRPQHYRFGYRDSSVTLYVKFTSVDGHLTLLDRTSPDAFSAKLSKTQDQRLVFEYRTGSGDPLLSLASETLVVPNRWYHLCVTKDDRQVMLYVNGALKGHKALGEQRVGIPGDQDLPLYLGASREHLGSLRGKLDEILFYNRALSEAEVRHLYQMRESGACRI